MGTAYKSTLTHSITEHSPATMATTMATTAVTAATAAAAATRFNLRGVCLRSSATTAKASLGNRAYGRSYSSGVGNVFCSSSSRRRIPSRHSTSTNLGSVSHSCSRYNSGVGVYASVASRRSSSSNSTSDGSDTSSALASNNFEEVDKVVTLKKGRARLFQEGNPIVYGGAVHSVQGNPLTGQSQNARKTPHY